MKPTIPRIEIHVREPNCVRWVARQVRSDFARLSAQIKKRRLPLRIVCGTEHPLVEELLRRHGDVSHDEGFIIDVLSPEDPVLVVAARHFRGTMYGLLEISRRLGIDPLEYFSDSPPRDLGAKLSFPLVSKQPAFRYRGPFLCQEDLLAAWKKPNGPIPLSVYDQIFLAMLRLGANMILPASFLSTDSSILELAVKRGLILAQHHFQVLGTDVGRLTASQMKKYSIIRFRDETMKVWRQSIARNRHRETIWTLGYRGYNDHPFWFNEPGTFSDKRKGQVISAAIKAQLGLLHEELGSKQVPCAYYLYRENQVLYQEGHVRVPKGVAVVWCDNGYGRMESIFRDGYELWGMGQGRPIPATGKVQPAWPRGEQSGGGVYCHASFYDGAAPNRTQYVSPQQLQSTFVRARQKKLDGLMLLNTGSIREFVLSIEAAFDYCRDPEVWSGDPDYHETFLLNWCAKHFGKQWAKPTASVYQLLYAAHWRWSTFPGRCFGDNIVQYMLQDILSSLVASDRITPFVEMQMPEMSAKQIVEVICKEGAASKCRWEIAVAKAEKLKNRLPKDARTFFYENAVAQARRGLGAISVVVLAAQAVTAYEKNDQVACLNLLDRAKQAMADWTEALAATDRRPKWRGWSKGDVIVLPHVVEHYLGALDLLLKARLGELGKFENIIEHLSRGSDHE